MNQAAAPGALGTLSGHTLVYLAGSLAAKVTAFLLLPILTRVLTPADYGVLELTDSTLSLLLQLVGFHFDSALQRFYLDKPEGRARDRVVSTAFVSLSLLSLAAFLVLFVASDWLAAALLQRPDLPHAFRLVAVILVAMVLTELPSSVLRAERRSLAVTGWLLLRLVLELVLKIVLVVAFAMGVIGVLAGQAAAAFLFVLGFSAWLVRRHGLAFDAKLLKEMAAYSAPMVVAGFCQFALHQADRYMLSWLSTLEQLGLYGVGYRFGSAVNGIVLAAFLFIWFPFVFSLRDAEARRRVLSQAAVHVPALLLLLSLPIAMLAPEIVALLTAEAFHGAWAYVPVILFAYLFWGAFQVFQTPFFVHKRTGTLPLLLGLAVLVNVALNFVLLPRGGPFGGSMGAALATVAALAFLAAMIRVRAQRIEAFPVAWGRLAVLLAVCAAAGTALYAVPVEDPRSLPARVAVLAALVAFLAFGFLRRDERAQVVALLRSLRRPA